MLLPGPEFVRKYGPQHHGIVVYTNKGNKYLIHSTPGEGTVVTDAEMSENWVKKSDISVRGEKLVGLVFQYASGSTNDKFVNYITSGTCILTAEQAEFYLKNSLEEIITILERKILDEETLNLQLNNK
jgi:hypothetical protein